MRNKVEILRAIEFTVEDLDNIINLDDIDDFSDKDKEFVEEFKKIYELGLTQLERFINKLDEEGEDLDEYSIQYYVRCLLNGPLGNYARELSEDKNYFVETPDIMGILGNNLFSTQNSTVLPGYEYSLGTSVEIFNKIPGFIQDSLSNSMEQTESLFRNNLFSSTIIDNTLPIIDKAPQDRYDEEPTGEWVLKSNGSYLVKDSYFKLALESLNQTLFEEIKNYLEDENYRIYIDKKSYNPFGDDNDSISSNLEIKRNEMEGDNEQEISLDLMGKVQDSFEKRRNVLKIENIEKDEEYALNTNEGQLGN